MRCNMTLDLRRVPDRQSRRPTPPEECPVDPAAASIDRHSRLICRTAQGAVIGSMAVATKVVSQIAMASSSGRGRSRGTGGLRRRRRVGEMT